MGRMGKGREKREGREKKGGGKQRFSHLFNATLTTEALKFEPYCLVVSGVTMGFSLSNKNQRKFSLNEILILSYPIRRAPPIQNHTMLHCRNPLLSNFNVKF